MVDLCTILHIQPAWQQSLKNLNQDNIWHLSKAKNSESESKIKPWRIWMTEGVQAIMIQTMFDCKKVCNILIQICVMLMIFIALCIEWCKARAKAMHWSEEVTLLMEEMHQVKQFMSWQSIWWNKQACRQDNLEPVQMEGIIAYAKHQVTMRDEM